MRIGASASSDPEPASREQSRSSDGVKVCTVNMDLTWLDVGSWLSFKETLAPDADANAVSGNARIMKSRDTLVVNADLISLGAG